MADQKMTAAVSEYERAARVFAEDWGMDDVSERALVELLKRVHVHGSEELASLRAERLDEAHEHALTIESFVTRWARMHTDMLEAQRKVEKQLDASRDVFLTYLRERDSLREQLEKAKAERDQEARTVKSLATMLGWGNVPPRETLERSVSELNRANRRLTEERDAKQRAFDVAIQQTLTVKACLQKVTEENTRLKEIADRKSCSMDP